MGIAEEVFKVRDQRSRSQQGQMHCSGTGIAIITLSRLPFSSSLKVNNRSFRHASPCLWNQLPKELRLPTDHKDLSLSSDLTRVSSSFPSSPVYCYHPLLLLISTPDSKLIFSINLFLRSSSTFSPTGLTPWTPAVFRFSRACRF